MSEQQIGAYKVLKSLGVELRFKLDNLGYEAKFGDKVKELIDAYAEGVKSGHIELKDSLYDIKENS